MKNNKITTIIVILATIALAGIAIYTAIRLYQLRSSSVAPNVPESFPNAGFTTPTPIPTIACQLSFAIATPSPSPSPTPTKSPSPSPTPTKSPSPSPSPSPNPLCNSVCTTNAQCPSGLGCYKATGQTSGNCRNMACTSYASCLCPTASPSPSPSPSPTPTKSPSPSPTPLITGTPSPTPSPVPQCNNSCTSSAQCPSGLSCYIASGTTGNCRNTSCVGEADCTCPSATSTPSPTATTYIAQGPTATPAPQPTLPESGTDWPTVAGAFFGFLVIVGSLLLAF